jgi:hypothetical protein
MCLCFSEKFNDTNKNRCGSVPCRAIKVGVFICALTLLLFPIECLAGYKVLLKSEESLFVEDYWVDKIDSTVIRLLINGENMRYPRGDIRYIAPRSIEDIGVNTIIKRLTFASRTEYSTADIQTPVGSEDPKTFTAADNTSPVSAFLQQEATALEAKQKREKEAYEETLISGDLEARQKAREKILKWADDWKELTVKVKYANGGELPDWWRW